jgi:hypothetical protein
MTIHTYNPPEPNVSHQTLVIELNECWSYWLSRMYPGIHSSHAIKSLVIGALDEFAKHQPDPVNAHEGFFSR